LEKLFDGCTKTTQCQYVLKFEWKSYILFCAVQYLLLSATFLSHNDSHLKPASECGTQGSCVHAVSVLLQIITVVLFKYKFALFIYSIVLQKCVCERELDFTGSVQNCIV
jgi:hypothetical protein